MGFIGLGLMGTGMSKNLVEAGYPVTVWNRTASKMKPLVEAGAKAAGSPREVAENSEVVVSIVTDSPDVEEVLLGENGAVHGAKEGDVFIDMSTISPIATREMAERLAEKGVEMLDAPVSGGVIGATNGTLSIMVGGKREVFDECMPILEAMGKTITYIGGIGDGQVCKAVNQILVGTTMLGVAEALVFAKKAGVENVDALKQAIRDEHEREYKQIARMHLKRALLDELAERYDFDVPEALVEQELAGIWTQFESQRKENPEAVEAEYGGKDDDEVKAEFRDISVRRIRLGLVLAEVGQANNIQVTKEDINRAIMAEARRYPGQEQRVIEFYRGNSDAMNALQAPLLEDRVVDFILEMADVNDKKVSREELMRDPDAEDAPATEPKKKAASKSKGTAKKKAAPKKTPAKKAETKDKA